jgi:hypothetical protein
VCNVSLSPHKHVLNLLFCPIDRGYKEYLEGSSKPRVDRYRSGLGSSSGANVLSGSNAVAIGVNKRMRDARDSPDNATRKTQRMEDRYVVEGNLYFLVMFPVEHCRNIK